METPGTIEQTFHQGIELLGQGQAEKALQAFEHVLARHPHAVSARLCAIRALSFLGRQADAISRLTDLIQLDPNSVQLPDLWQLSQFLVESGQHERALTCAERLLKIDAQQVEFHRHYAQCLVRLGKFEHAKRSYQRMLLLFPELANTTNKQHFRSTIPYNIWHLTCCIDELTEDTEQCPEVLSLIETAAESDYYRALEYTQQGELDRALVCFTSSIEKDPKLAEAYYCLGLVLMVLWRSAERRDLLPQAFTAFSVAKQLRPQWVQPMFRYAYAGCRLPADQRPHNFDAVEIYKECLALDSTFEQPLSEIAAIYAKNGNLPEAFRWYTEYYNRLEKRAENHPLSRLGVRFMEEHAVTAIGHMAQTPDSLIKSQILGKVPQCHTVLIAPPAMTANPALLKLWEKYFTVIRDESLIRQLRPLIRELGRPSWLGILPDKSLAYTNFSISYLQYEWEQQGRAPLLSIPEDMRMRGRQILQKLGMPEDAWFVCLHVRQAGYKPEQRGDLFDQMRNADPLNYMNSIDQIAAAGGWVIRAGEPTMDPLPGTKNLIEYARSEFKSDWMDIFLCGECRFFLGGSGGIIGVPQLFHRPLIATDYPPGSIPLNNPCDIVCPQLLFSKKRNRLLTFNEMLSPPFAFTEDLGVFDQEGIVFVKNSPDEILEATREMLEQSQGTLRYSKEDEELQQRFRTVGPNMFGMKLARISRYFLQKHVNLFD